MINGTLPEKSFADSASDKYSYLIGKCDVQEVRVLQDSSVSEWTLSKLDQEEKTYYFQKQGFMLQFKSKVRKFLGESLEALGTPVAENLSKISAEMQRLDVIDMWMRHRSDEQMQYIFKLSPHLSLEIISPLMKSSQGEFYSLYCDGECQRMSVGSIDNIVTEMLNLKEFLGKNA